jgi:hypothetical protein
MCKCAGKNKNNSQWTSLIHQSKGAGRGRKEEMVLFAAWSAKMICCKRTLRPVRGLGKGMEWLLVLAFSAYIVFFFIAAYQGTEEGGRVTDMCQRGMWVDVLAP